MNKRNYIIIIFVLLCIFGIYIVKQESNNKKNQEKEKINIEIYKEQKLKNDEELVILNFTESNCESCASMNTLLNEVVKEYNGALRVRDIYVYEELRITRQYKIKAVPTQIFLDLNDNELYRNEGTMSKNQIKDIIEKHRGKINE